MIVPSGFSTSATQKKKKKKKERKKRLRVCKIIDAIHARKKNS